MPAASVERAACQSDITTPSKPHSPFSGSVSSGLSVIVIPPTRLYEAITDHGRAPVTICSNGARYTSRRAWSLTRTSTVIRSVSLSLAT